MSSSLVRINIHKNRKETNNVLSVKPRKYLLKLGSKAHFLFTSQIILHSFLQHFIEFDTLFWSVYPLFSLTSYRIWHMDCLWTYIFTLFSKHLMEFDTYLIKKKNFKSGLFVICLCFGVSIRFNCRIFFLFQFLLRLLLHTCKRQSMACITAKLLSFFFTVMISFRKSITERNGLITVPTLMWVSFVIEDNFKYVTCSSFHPSTYSAFLIRRSCKKS